MHKNTTKIATKVVHAGVEPEEITGAVMTPIFQTSTYAQKGPADHTGFEYSRAQNPTRFALEASLRELEGGKHGFAFASGLAAIDTLMRHFRPGDEIICANDLYGGSYRLFTKVYEPFGIKFHFTDMSEASNIEPFINEKTKMVWVETPTNPMMGIIDIEAVSEYTRKHNILLAVDNTFCSPVLQQPLSLGADIVMHSITKYIGGHSDVIMGCLVVNDDNLAEELAFLQMACGAVPAPMDCFLVLRGIKTLSVRMQAHCRNAASVAEFLRGHEKVAKVYYPGFEDHPNHDIAKKQMAGFGGMVSFRFKDEDMAKVARFMQKCEIFTLAESLGGVESLNNHPATMTHASIPADKREELGITSGFIRLSCGIEDAEDMIADLAQAMQD